MKKFSILLMMALLYLQTAIAQYSQIGLQEKVNGSDLIIEGQVVEQFTYEKNGLILTASKLNVCDIIYEKIVPQAALLHESRIGS